MQSRAQPVIQQDSTDSLLDVPMLEALQRRHSDVKINPASAGMRQLTGKHFQRDIIFIPVFKVTVFNV